jgi:hypothetical protein
VIADFARAGFFEKPEKKQRWTPETEKNLQVLFTAVKMHHGSEDAYPAADKWMDQIEKRVRTNLLSKDEALKKFVDPAAANGAGGGFGFAFNEVASAKYVDDLPDKDSTILIFQSTDTRWNAHGDPAKIGREGGIGINAKGEIVPLSNAEEQSPKG